MFMTAVVFTYLMVAPEGFGLEYDLSMIIGLSATARCWFILCLSNHAS